MNKEKQNPRVIKGFQTNGPITRYVEADLRGVMDNVAPMVYTMSQDPETGEFLLLTTMQRFPNEKLYGTVLGKADKIINAYNDREKSTGILATGDKGGGKSSLIKLVGNKFIDAGLPVILINQAFFGDGFNNFLEKIGECVVLFDEFAKVYGKGEESYQKKLLTLLDGTMSISKKLYLFTENNRRDINDFMIDRPGRIYYHFKYGKLDDETVRAVCDEKLKKTERLESILSYSRSANTFGFDILNTIIAECNRMSDKESFGDLIKDLNVESQESYTKYEVINMDITKAYKHIPSNAKIKIINKEVKDGQAIHAEFPEYDQRGRLKSDFSEDKAIVGKSDKKVQKTINSLYDKNKHDEADELELSLSKRIQHKGNLRVGVNFYVSEKVFEKDDLTVHKGGHEIFVTVKKQEPVVVDYSQYAEY